MTDTEDKNVLDESEKNEMNLFRKNELVNPVDYENKLDLQKELIEEAEAKK